MEPVYRRAVSLAILSLAALPLLAADPAPPPPDDGKDDPKPLGDVILTPDRYLKPLLGTPPPAPGFGAVSRAAGGGGGGTCFLQQCNQNVYCFPGTNSACLLQTFQETQWRICVYTNSKEEISVGPVDLKRTATSPWRRILYKAMPAEIFSAYHTGGTHFYDTQFASMNSRRTVTPDDAGPFGIQLYLSHDALFGPTVVAECKDRGLGWLCKGPSSSYTRRGQELLLWGVYDAGNYDYVLEYGFHDDGVMTFRVGATGYNSPPQPDIAHMHDVLWRIDMDLNGWPGDTARFTQHVEGIPTPPDATDFEGTFNGGFEGAADWNAEEFNSLLIEDTATNASLNPMGYELQPERTGTARHFATSPCTENWSLHDFWVTRWHGGEDNGWASPWHCPDDYLSLYPANHESVVNRDLVLWYLASAHHDPIDEDKDPGLNWGVTLMHWFGFQLEPHNYFDHNPLGGLDVCP